MREISQEGPGGLLLMSWSLIPFDPKLSSRRGPSSVVWPLYFIAVCSKEMMMRMVSLGDRDKLKLEWRVVAPGLPDRHRRARSRYARIQHARTHLARSTKNTRISKKRTNIHNVQGIYSYNHLLTMLNKSMIYAEIIWRLLDGGKITTFARQAMKHQKEWTLHSKVWIWSANQYSILKCN